MAKPWRRRASSSAAGSSRESMARGRRGAARPAGPPRLRVSGREQAPAGHPRGADRRALAARRGGPIGSVRSSRSCGMSSRSKDAASSGSRCQTARGSTSRPAAEGLHRAESAVARGDLARAWGPGRVTQHVAAREFLPGEDAPWIDAAAPAAGGDPPALAGARRAGLRRDRRRRARHGGALRPAADRPRALPRERPPAADGGARGPRQPGGGAARLRRAAAAAAGRAGDRPKLARRLYTGAYWARAVTPRRHWIRLLASLSRSAMHAEQ